MALFTMGRRLLPSRFISTLTLEISSSFLHTSSSSQHPTLQELRILRQLRSLLPFPLKPSTALISPENSPAPPLSPEKSPAPPLPEKSPAAPILPEKSPAALKSPEKSPAALKSQEKSPAALVLPEKSPSASLWPEKSLAAPMLPEKLQENICAAVPEKNPARCVDSFLSTEDRLRGVFLQKLPGRSAVEGALSSVGADLTLKTVSEVLGHGNLSGESMVTFFEWAIKQPSISFPKIDGYHVVLRALARRKFFSFVPHLLHVMHVRNINPNFETLSISLTSFLKANRVAMALSFFKTAPNFGILIDTRTLNAALARFCGSGHPRAAAALLDSGRTPPDRETFHILLAGWSKLGRVDSVYKTLTRMTRSGFDLDNLALRHLIEALGRSGHPRTASTVLNHIETASRTPDTSIYNSIILNFVLAGDVTTGLSYFKRMTGRRCDPNTETYVTLIRGMLRVRRVADALELLEDMVGRGLAPSSGAISSFIYKLCRYGPPHAAILVYRVGRRAGCRLSARVYKMLLMRLSKFGKCDTMLRVWGNMREDGWPSDAEVYAHLMVGLCNIGRLETAVLLVEESLRLGFCPKWTARGKLNAKLMEAGKVDVAYKLLLKVRAFRRDENMRRDWRAKGWHF